MKALGIVLAIMVILVFLALIGAVLVWALNTLFSLSIPYAWDTILAALVLGAAVGSSAASSAVK